ncbi:catalytic activity protein [[Candida] boidinii]|nr:catalytic activity protein [[Candida] boidinii]
MSSKNSVFQLQSSFKVDYAPASVKKWRSSRTGLQLIVIDQESPIVNGYFAVATEIKNDSGSPHTLEHLIFMGSKKYPYKGLLDILGNLSYSSTNAWTATDQTVYTLTTAGWDGFRMLLPIYLDHLINPTLTDEACYTEVYHVDGSAKDKGVVYSEMQAIETQGWFLSGLETQRTLYKVSGYKSETGGLTSNLRTLTNDEIREFHKQNYRSDNLSIIITGSINETEFLETMESFDNELPDLPSIPLKRPFVDSEQDKPLTKRVVKTVEFPDKDESSGDVSLSWIGPDIKDVVTAQAVDILGSYLTKSSISLFHKHFIEIDNPLAASASFSTDDYIHTGMNVYLGSVPVTELETLGDKVLKLIEEHASNPKEFDLIRIRDLLEQTKWKFIFSCENSPEGLADISILDFLYGETDGSELKPWLKTLNEFEVLKSWSAEQWCDLLKKYYVDNKCAVMLSKPSAKCYKQLKDENKKLLKDRKLKLGKEGLEELKKKLKNAQDKNDAPIPNEILNKFKQPDPSKINFIETKSFAVGLNKDIKNDENDEIYKYISKDIPSDFPIYLHFENIDSQFVTLHILLSTLNMDPNLFKYIDIFVDLFSMPIKLEDGTELTFEEVVTELKRDTITTKASTSFASHFDEMVDFKIVVKREDYSKCIEWFYRLFFLTVFDEQRVKILVEKLVKELPDSKRSGSTMLSSVVCINTLEDNSLCKAVDCLTTEPQWKEALENLKNGDFTKIREELELARSQLFKINNMRIFVIGDISKIENPVSAWTRFLDQKQDSNELTPISYSKDVLSDAGKSQSKSAFLITAPGSQSTYLKAITKIPFDYSHEDNAKIFLACEYLQCVEGPFWRGIRGTGLAYGANIYTDHDYGQLIFSIYRGADTEKAFSVAKEIVNDFANEKTKIEHKMMEGAISSIVNSIANSASSSVSAATFKIFDDVLAKRGPNYMNTLMKKLTQITEEELLDTIRKYFVPLFNSESSMVFACVNPSKSKALGDFFEKKMGYDVNITSVSSNQDDDGANDDGESDENEDDDDDDDESSEDEDDDDESDDEENGDEESDEDKN